MQRERKIPTYVICGFGKGVRQGTKGLDLVVVEKEWNTGAACRHNTGHVSGYSDESENTTEYFDIEVGLHKGSALSPLLFIIVMDVLASEVRTHPPWGLLFADDLALCTESSAEVEEELQKWRRVLGENGLKISRVKTKYLRPTNCKDNIYRLRESVPTVDSFSYSGSTLQAEGGWDKDVPNRIRTGWNRWREMSDVICDKKVPEVLNNKIYKTAI